VLQALLGNEAVAVQDSMFWEIVLCKSCFLVHCVLVLCRLEGCAPGIGRVPRADHEVKKVVRNYNVLLFKTCFLLSICQFLLLRVNYLGQLECSTLRVLVVDSCATVCCRLSRWAFVLASCWDSGFLAALGKLYILRLRGTGCRWRVKANLCHWNY
jgi:hypothetical protein